jgi:hypothetical protein
MLLFKKLFVLQLLLIVSLTSQAQLFKKKKNKNKPVVAAPAEPEKGPKAYKKLITAKAITKRGLIDVHQIDEKYYFEIKDSLMGREMMSVTRFTKTTAGGGIFGGEEVNRQVIKWERGANNKIFLRSVTYVVASADSSKPMFTAVNNSNADPIIAVFEIKSIRKDTSLVIDVSDLFNSDNASFSISAPQKQGLKISAFQKDRSYINKIFSFPLNTEIKTVKTFDLLPPTVPGPGAYLPAGLNSGCLTFEFNTSLILLPKIPMRIRFYDQRVGFFNNEVTVFGEESQKTDYHSYAIRWRLEPKNAQDAERQKKGELIEPKKQIVYYIDPATPVKWRKYLKAGVDDWNFAFEKAGWKNAIKGEYWPEKDSTMSLEDARFSVIRYFASNIQNAYGPNVNDPRSGEILESHVGWFHNVMKLLHNWYLIQAAASDPRAQKKEFDDELMGQLIRFVSSHEIGHTLGLRHNMGASSATPVEKLRDKEWVAKNGHTASIMDYARFNYVAQPEDGVTDLFPRIGDYDKWAIQWGYSYFADAKSADEEKALLNSMTIESYKNPRLRFGTEISSCDPRYQTEDLGDDAMKASEYGIKNLQRILPHLIEWTNTSGESYAELEEIYGNLIGQFRRYMGHVTKNIGGIYDSPKTYDMPGDVYEVVPANIQKSALEFLNAKLFQTPTWLMDQNILNKIKPESGLEAVKAMQASVVNNLLAGDRLVRLMETGVLKPENFKLNDLISGMRSGIWSELKGAKQIDAYRRNLQKVFTAKLIELLKPENATVFTIPPGARYNMNTAIVNLNLTDLPSVVRANLELLKNDIKMAIATTSDALSKYHLQDMYQKIDLALNPR